MDCNNFFASCERLFRPDLWDKPVAVLSSNDGCIVARSQEVKDLGIPMGVPYFQVKDVCKKEGITLFSSNFTLYRDISARVMHALKEEVDGVEVYSIDEAFFRLSADVREEDVAAIRERIIAKVGIPVSIGIAPTKTLAKYESTLAKKGSGVHKWNQAAWPEESIQVRCSTIWGVGRQTYEKLRANNIEMVSELLAADTALVRNLLGINGVRLRSELSGIPAHDARAHEAQQSIMSSRSFKKETTERSVVESATAYHVSSVAQELRSLGMSASRLYVSIRPNRFKEWRDMRDSREVILEQPTADTQVLLKAAMRAVAEMYRADVPYKKAGVSVSGLIPSALVTSSLFEVPDTTRGLLDKTIDALNAKFGHNSVRPAVIMQTEKWAASAELRSPHYTTKWSDIATARA